MLHIEIAKGSWLISLFSDPVFINEWNVLASNTEGFHVLQEPDFLLPWYKHYEDEYEPILLIARNEEEELIGLMALAWNETKQFLTHGGHFASEYHGWLALPEVSDDFFTSCILAVKNHFPVKNWEWNFMPPHLPLNFTEQGEEILKKAGIFTLFKEEENPEWNLLDGAKLKKTLKSSSLRSKRNRLKRRGELRFEVISDHERAKLALAIAAIQCDFRKEAQHNVRPFSDDPRVMDFDLELIANTNCLHCCALWLDDKLLALHLGAQDEKRLHLGLITFDPSEYAASPGAILLAELAKYLTETGYEIFDITPGGDAYKQRYSNQATLIKKPMIFFSRAAYEKERIKLKGTTYLKDKGLLSKVKELNKARKEFSLKSWKRGNGVQAECVDKFVRIERISIPDDVALEPVINSQKYADLMHTQGLGKYSQRRELLIEAFEKFKKSERLYSSLKSEQLFAYGWMRKIKKEEELSGQILPQGSTIIYDFFCLEENEKTRYFPAILREMWKIVKKEESPIFLLLPEEDFPYVESIITQSPIGLQPA